MTAYRKDSEYNALKIQAANDAIEILGGPKKAAEKIRFLTGKSILATTIQKWKENGISPGWHPVIHALTHIPLYELDPDIYPEYLFPNHRPAEIERSLNAR